MQSTLPLPLDASAGAPPFAGTFAGKAVLALAATALVALCAHVSLPLYFTPVPLTLQDFAVLLVGLMLGPSLGAGAMVLYLAEGAIGLPVFNPHGLGGVAQLFGPTGGYLLAYPFAAVAAGSIVRALRAVRSRMAAAVLAGIAFNALLFAFGASWFACEMHLGAPAVWRMSIEPFLPGAVLKIATAAGLATSLHRWRQF
jgi:biotin transport system substrate-specific component